MGNAKEVLDAHLMDDGEVETLWQKTVSKVSIVNSTLLLILNTLYFYYWNLATEFLGWRPFTGDPDPKDMGSISTRGNYELKDIVINNYETVYNSLLAFYMLNLISIIGIISLPFILKGNKRIFITIYVAIGLVISFYHISGGFLGWICD